MQISTNFQQLGNLLSLSREIAGARDILQKFENLKNNTSGISTGVSKTKTYENEDRRPKMGLRNYENEDPPRKRRPTFVFVLRKRRP
jgi:hypothetical protein